ncbi:MAG TPA: hypothetical protein VJ646_12645, partial [Candidatus Binatia bacterium]|nr:hypothetical protein [Candidatus Binatia bacterium]
MKRVSPATAIVIFIAFAAGLSSHVLYQRWNPGPPQPEEIGVDRGIGAPGFALEPKSHRVTYMPLGMAAQVPAEMPLLPARDVEKIRSLTGSPARVRGRIFRVGHSAKSNTYFLNFGPSREALTAVIFASAAELFEKNKTTPKSFEGREVE